MKYTYLLRYGIFLVAIFGFLIRYIEKLTYHFFERTPFIHNVTRKKRLSALQKQILLEKVDFYQKLDENYQKHFEHRLAIFLRTYQFIGRDGFQVNAEVKILIASSYITLTFGKRKFITDVFDKIIVYPDIFHSIVNKRKHKGEFNPKYKIVVFSWKHFLEGIAIKDDNINLGIHEFTHVIHIKSLREKDFSSFVFKKEYQRLINYLQDHESIRKKIIASEYFRSYAFENQYEFMAVLIESFIETPQQFKTQFPRIYRKIKRMLNYHFLDY